MTTNYLWFVLAGFLLGFVTSTLWEWYHFRKERLKLTDRRIRELEEQVRELETSAAQNAGDPEWSARAYRSPGVFLESEEFAGEKPPVAPAVPMVSSLDPTASPSVVAADVAPSEAEGVPLRSGRGDAVPLSGRTAATRSRQQLLESLRRNSDVMQRGQAPRGEPVAAQDAPQPTTIQPPVADADVSAPAVTTRTNFVDVTRMDNGASVYADNPSAPTAVVAESDTRAWRNNAALTRRTEEFPDDLLKIKGIGEVYKQRLYRAGICTWRQIAETDLDVLRKATGAYPSSNVEEWPVQAHKLMEKHGRNDAVYQGPMPDDLTKILGIGPVSASTLYRVGICTYEQLAMTPEADLSVLFPIAVAGDQPDFAAWITRAAALADAKHRG